MISAVYYIRMILYSDTNYKLSYIPFYSNSTCHGISIKLLLGSPNCYDRTAGTKLNGRFPRQPGRQAVTVLRLVN